MTQSQAETLYDQDFYQWIEQTITCLKAGNLEALDRVNLIEEIDALGKREKRELENCLITLFEHALKRKYVPLEDCYRGWEVTIRRTQKDILIPNWFGTATNECLYSKGLSCFICSSIFQVWYWLEGMAITMLQASQKKVKQNLTLRIPKHKFNNLGVGMTRSTQLIQEFASVKEMFNGFNF